MSRCCVVGQTENSIKPKYIKKRIASLQIKDDKLETIMC